eukprot:523586-Pelagomonas_calceolata.AAC.6
MVGACCVFPCILLCRDVPRKEALSTRCMVRLFPRCSEPYPSLFQSTVASLARLGYELQFFCSASFSFTTTYLVLLTYQYAGTGDARRRRGKVRTICTRIRRAGRWEKAAGRPAPGWSYAVMTLQRRFLQHQDCKQHSSVKIAVAS